MSSYFNAITKSLLFFCSIAVSYSVDIIFSKVIDIDFPIVIGIIINFSRFFYQCNQ